MGKLLIVGGLLMAALGALILVGVPIGRLPGDFVYRRGNTTFYFPLVTSLVLSVVFTLLMTLFRR